MIIVKLRGGLGNQMFQYAAGLSLALKHNTTIKIDDTALIQKPAGNDTPRHFELNIFEKPVTSATNKEIQDILSNYNSKITREIQRRFPFLFNKLRAVESGSHYHTEFDHYPKNTYLEGFWQSELYFIKYENQIRDYFDFKSDIKNENSGLVETIKSHAHSVSIHIRRGDYVSNVEANKFHGLCSLEYYKDAVNYLSTKFKKLNLYVFSDDLDWCKEHLKFDFPMEFIQTLNPQSDLYLMTQCQHNIIANSSFSWWGAWLNGYKDKIVIAPKKWFADSSINTTDLIPKSWIKL